MSGNERQERAQEYAAPTVEGIKAAGQAGTSSRYAPTAGRLGESQPMDGSNFALWSFSQVISRLVQQLLRPGAASLRKTPTQRGAAAAAGTGFFYLGGLIVLPLAAFFHLQANGALLVVVIRIAHGLRCGRHQAGYVLDVAEEWTSQSHKQEGIR